MGTILEDFFAPVTVINEDDSIQGTNLNLALILTDEIPQVLITTRTKEYFALADVGTDWGTISKVYKAAVPHFQQTPHNEKIKIGLQIPKGFVQNDVAISVFGETATITDTAHGLSVGQEITNSDSSLSPLLNGVKVITDVPDANTLKFAAGGVTDSGPGTIDYHTGDADITAALNAIFTKDSNFFQLLSIFKTTADIKEIAAWVQPENLKYTFSVENPDIFDVGSNDLFSQLKALNYTKTSGYWFHQSGVDAAGVSITVSPTINANDINVSGEIATLSSPLTHGLKPPEKITVSGAAEALLNGIKTILSTPGLKDFTFAAPGVGDGPDANNGAIDYINNNSEKATVTKALHGLRVNDDLTDSGADTSGLNGDQTVLQVLDENRFTFPAAGIADGADANNGSIIYFARYAFLETGVEGLLLGASETETTGIGAASWANKQITGFAATPDDILSPTEAVNILNKNGNIYKSLKGFAQTLGGRTFQGRTVKVQSVSDWLEVRLQEANLQLLIEVAQLLYTNGDISIITNAQQVPFNTQLTRGGLTPLSDEQLFEILYPLASEIPQIDKNANIIKGTAKARSGNEILRLELTAKIVT